MPVHYTIDASAGLVYVALQGVVRLSDVRDYLMQLRTDPEFNPDFGRLINVSSANIALSNEELRILGAELVRIGRVAGARRAYVSADDLNYGLCRVLQAWSADSLEEFQSFRSAAEALEWLKGQECQPSETC